MSIFFRAVNDDIVNELKKRYDGKTSIRNASYKIYKEKAAAKANGQLYTELPRRKAAWIEIYDEDGNFFYGYGKQEYAQINEKVTVDIYNERKKKFIKTKRTAYLIEKLDVSIAGDYGTLRNFNFSFSINVRQPEEQNDEFDRVFNKAQKTFTVGKKILIRYGWNDTYQYNDRRSRRLKTGTIAGYNPNVNKVNDGVQELKGNTGLIFTVVKPEYSINALQKIMFNISGVGPGADLSEKNIVVDQPETLFDGVFKQGLLNNVGKYYKPFNEKQKGAYFTTDYDANVDEGKHALVQNIVDWIDFDVQSHVIATTGLSTFNNFTAENGAANIGVYAPPPVDKRFNKGDVNGDYKQTGFVIFELDAEYYDNKYTIEDDYDGDLNYTYYVTLQYIAWLFNWILNDPNIIGLSDSERDKKIKEQKDAKMTSYQIICNPEVTKGNLLYTDKTVPDKPNYFLPSSNPFNVLFSYGPKTDDHHESANYGATFEKYNWVIGAAAVVATVVVGVVTAGTLGAIVGAGIAMMGYYDDFTNKLQFTHSNSDEPQVHDIRGNLLSADIQRAFSMQQQKGHGNLANILINRDCIASIIDELGGLTRSKEKETDDVSSITTEKFFTKLFDIIKESSGDAINLKLVPDPDNTERHLSKSLIVNENEPPPADEKIHVPMFNKTDGSTVEMILTSKIPKSIQTSAAVGGAGNIAKPPEPTENKEDGAVDEKEESSPITATLSQILTSKDALVKSQFSADKSRALTGVLKSIVTGEPDAKSISSKIMKIFPLEMTLTILGTEGFKFGDTISCKLLPPQYRRISGTKTQVNSQGSSDGIFINKTVFTVTKVNHVFRGTDWKTSLDTVMRFMPGGVVELEPVDKVES